MKTGMNFTPVEKTPSLYILRLKWGRYLPRCKHKQSGASRRKYFISCRFPDGWTSWFKQILINAKLKTKIERSKKQSRFGEIYNPLNPELSRICYLLALLGAHHFLHVSRIKVKLLTFMLLMSYIYIYIWSTHS